MRVPPCVLTIAGSDSGGGAGIQADAATIRAIGGHALTAVTAVTAQNGRRVAVWQAVPPALIAAQLQAVRQGFAVAAAKTGLLPSAAAIRAVARELRKNPRFPLVVDPVIGSTSGTRFLSREGLRVLKRELLPLAALVTPNWPEAEALAGIKIRSDADAEAAARKLALDCGCAVLVKGGHSRGRRCRDCLVLPRATSSPQNRTARDDRVRWYDGMRIKTKNTHGTGCVLSAAIATELARGRPLAPAIAAARRFLRQNLTAGRRSKWKGRGPALV